MEDSGLFDGGLGDLSHEPLQQQQPDGPIYGYDEDSGELVPFGGRGEEEEEEEEEKEAGPVSPLLLPSDALLLPDTPLPPPPPAAAAADDDDGGQSERERIQSQPLEVAADEREDLMQQRPAAAAVDEENARQVGPYRAYAFTGLVPQSSAAAASLSPTAPPTPGYGGPKYITTKSTRAQRMLESAAAAAAAAAEPASRPASSADAARAAAAAAAADDNSKRKGRKKTPKQLEEEKKQEQYNRESQIQNQPIIDAIDWRLGSGEGNRLANVPFQYPATEAERKATEPALGKVVLEKDATFPTLQAMLTYWINQFNRHFHNFADTQLPVIKGKSKEMHVLLPGEIASKRAIQMKTPSSMSKLHIFLALLQEALLPVDPETGAPISRADPRAIARRRRTFPIIALIYQLWWYNTRLKTFAPFNVREWVSHHIGTGPGDVKFVDVMKEAARRYNHRLRDPDAKKLAVRHVTEVKRRKGPKAAAAAAEESEAAAEEEEEEEEEGEWNDGGGGGGGAWEGEEEEEDFEEIAPAAAAAAAAASTAPVLATVSNIPAAAAAGDGGTVANILAFDSDDEDDDEAAEAAATAAAAEEKDAADYMEAMMQAEEDFNASAEAVRIQDMQRVAVQTAAAAEAERGRLAEIALRLAEEKARGDIEIQRLQAAAAASERARERQEAAARAQLLDEIAFVLATYPAVYPLELISNVDEEMKSIMDSVIGGGGGGDDDDRVLRKLYARLSLYKGVFVAIPDSHAVLMFACTFPEDEFCATVLREFALRFDPKGDAPLDIGPIDALIKETLRSVAKKELRLGHVAGIPTDEQLFRLAREKMSHDVATYVARAANAVHTRALLDGCYQRARDEVFSAIRQNPSSSAVAALAEFQAMAAASAAAAAASTGTRLKIRSSSPPPKTCGNCGSDDRGCNGFGLVGSSCKCPDLFYCCDMGRPGVRGLCETLDGAHKCVA